MTDRIAPDDPALLASVRLGEGLRLRAYPDPESPLAAQMALALAQRTAGWSVLSGAPWTIGYGHTGEDVRDGRLVWTLTQAEAALVADLTDICATLDAREPWWRGTTAGRQRVLAEMGFNLGYGRLAGFHRMLLAMQTQRWDQASAEMLDSQWAHQVGARAQRLAAAMAAG